MVGATASGGMVTITADDGGVSLARVDRILPAPGITVSAGIEVTTNGLDLQGGDSATLKVTALSVGGSSLGVTTVNLPATGVYTASLVLPTNTYTVRVSVEAFVAASQPPKTMVFRRGSLRVGAVGTPVAY